ncbi:MAG: transcription-repair coupling factor [Lachnospiraceae bacterium]|nr:transcription-repair coupling factor [Lachnospiraceae bacterium]
MNAFLIPYLENPIFDSMRSDLSKKKTVALSGVSDAEKAALIYGAGSETKVKLVVTFDELKAKALYEELSFFEPETYYYPGKDLLFYQSDIHGNALTLQRLSALRALFSGENVTIVTEASSLMNRLPKKNTMQEGIITLESEKEYDLTEVKNHLSQMGYENVSKVYEPGEFAVRGGIIDVYPLTEDLPVRIEFFGDEIDSIRSFDPETQKSVENREDITIYPAMELILTEDEMQSGVDMIRAEAKELSEAFRKEMKTQEAFRIKTKAEEVTEELLNGLSPAVAESFLLYFTDETENLISYLPEDSALIIDQPTHVYETLQTVFYEFTDSMQRRLEKGDILPKQADMLYSPDEVLAKIKQHGALLLSVLDANDKKIKADKKYSVTSHQGVSYNGSFPLLLKDLKKYKREKERVLLVTASRTRAKRITEDLVNEDLNAFTSDTFDKNILPGEIMVASGNIRRGYSYPDLHFTVIAESDIFGQRAAKKKKKEKKYSGIAIAGFNDLKPGDYVVHENHGLGIYRGIEKIEVDKIIKDYIKIEYAKGSALYILATQLDAIQKYGNADSGGKKVKLNTLGGKEWKETKAKVEGAVGVVAKELVDLYAARQKKNGYVYGEDTVWQKEFEESFPFEETESQLIAISDVKNDMMSKKIMDRLICGDVGYGKTEIAIRAAFKAVQEGKQVAFLAPTTILAEQHYNTFLERMKNYPVNLGLLCRFRTEAEQKETVKDLKDGVVDIVIGTHRLLSKDVEFKDLGLLIIDEEQRFGVSHKEKIKTLRENVDVISLSATPIPRTLHMSLIGIRDMTVLQEAPMDRMPIQTFVFEYNEEMIREAVVREMSRGGQVYYVVPRIRNIGEVAARIAELIPEARVAYIHGRMDERSLEKLMYDFINREIDVLIATTIIEIGLDISNVNTIIIHDADRLGLSQLYQLRGRVGRSNRTAYAFLMYKKDKMLKEVAEKRLAAIREYTELGSGIKIAMRDLEIRGAGNLLGKEQHGHMAAVGYDLYCKMLNTAVLKEKGEEVPEQFETTVEMNIDAFIPPSYIKDEVDRIDIYKRIALIHTEDERDEMLDELIDRFGEPQKSVLNLLLIALIKMEANKAGITLIKERAEDFLITVRPDAPVEPEKIPEFLKKHEPYVRFVADPANPRFVFFHKLNNRIKRSDLPDTLLTFIKDFKSCQNPLKNV